MTSTAKEHFLTCLSKIGDDLPHVHESAWVEPASIPFTADVRAACEANRCGKYGTCWTCPPGVGHWEDLRDKYRAYREAYVFTTCHALEDSFDFEGMQEAAAAHKRLDNWISSEMNAFSGQYVHLGAGACTICKTCTYPDAPCRFPDRARQSMEACGIDVVNLSRACGIHYINGADTVTYFSLLLF
ncbi:MAG: DUF2284 domain-containing protein [Clostridia bacterium]|nr:DUF2284 domain-containing protein [Clostridia bacterium]